MSTSGLSRGLANLPGVRDAFNGAASRQVTGRANTGAATATRAAPAAMVYEGTGSTSAARDRQRWATEDAQLVLQSNPEVVTALRDSGLPPSAQGVALVAARAAAHGPAFAQVVVTAARMTDSLGLNPTANTAYQRAAADFAQQARLGPQNTADLTAIVTLLMREYVESWSISAQVRSQSLQAQIDANKKLIAAMQDYERSLESQATDMTVNGTKSVLVVESDFQLEGDQVVRVADAEPNGEIKGELADGAKLAEEAQASQPQNDSGEGAKMGGEGAKVDGAAEVPPSVTNPPKIVEMTADQLRAEIEETQQQIAALQAANAQLSIELGRSTSAQSGSGLDANVMAVLTDTAAQIASGQLSVESGTELARQAGTAAGSAPAPRRT